MKVIVGFLSFSFIYFVITISNVFASQYGGVHVSPTQSAVIGGMKYLALALIVGIIYLIWRVLKKVSSVAYKASKDKINDIVQNKYNK